MLPDIFPIHSVRCLFLNKNVILPGNKYLSIVSFNNNHTAAGVIIIRALCETGFALRSFNFTPPLFCKDVRHPCGTRFLSFRRSVKLKISNTLYSSGSTECTGCLILSNKQKPFVITEPDGNYRDTACILLSYAADPY